MQAILKHFLSLMPTMSLGGWQCPNWPSQRLRHSMFESCDRKSRPEKVELQGGCNPDVRSTEFAGTKRLHTCMGIVVLIWQDINISMSDPVKIYVRYWLGHLLHISVLQETWHWRDAKVQFSKVANLHASQKRSECEYSSGRFHHTKRTTKGTLPCKIVSEKKPLLPWRSLLKAWAK